MPHASTQIGTCPASHLAPLTWRTSLGTASHLAHLTWHRLSLGASHLAPPLTWRTSTLSNASFERPLQIPHPLGHQRSFDLTGQLYACRGLQLITLWLAMTSHKPISLTTRLALNPRLVLLQGVSKLGPGYLTLNVADCHTFDFLAQLCATAARCAACAHPTTATRLAHKPTSNTLAAQNSHPCALPCTQTPCPPPAKCACLSCPQAQCGQLWDANKHVPQTM